ncbi:MAG: hypothetical protein IPN33_17910 [Saprospiraceae bacterium]|nr:hypothetical protein [Saprospiraceae bacterium]
MHNPSLYRHPGLLALFRAAQRESRMQMIAALTILALGIALGWLFFSKACSVSRYCPVTSTAGPLLDVQRHSNMAFGEPSAVHQLLHRQPHRIVGLYDQSGRHALWHKT